MKKVVLAVSILLVSLVSCKKEEDNPNAPTNPKIEKESSKGKLSKIVESSLDNETEAIFTHNKNGFVSEIDVDSDEVKHVYKYNEKNYLVEYERKEASLAETTTYTYRYDEDGFLISSTRKDISDDNSDKTEKSISTYKHDEKGNIIEKSTIRKSERDRGKTEEYIENYSYDDNGNIIKIFRSDEKEPLVYSYDDKKNPFKNIFPKNAFDVTLPLFLMCNNNVVEMNFDDLDKNTWKYVYNKKGYPLNATMTTYSKENTGSETKHKDFKKQRVSIMEFYYNE